MLIKYILENTNTMTYTDTVLEQTRGYQRFFQRPVKEKAYDRLEQSLGLFDALGDRMVEAGLGVMILPLQEDETALRLNPDFTDEINRLAGGSAYYASNALKMILHPESRKAIAGAHHQQLVLCTDFLGREVFDHELAHFVYTNLLTDPTKKIIGSLFHETTQYHPFREPHKQINSEEYFARSTEAHLGRKGMFGPHRKLRKKDPQLARLISDVLEGKKGLIKAT